METPIPPTDRAGLCASCAHCRKVLSDRGSTFYQCRRAETDPRYEQYPRLPVLRCAGYEAIMASDEGSDE